MNTNSKHSAVGKVDPEEKGDSLKRPCIHGLVSVLVDGPGWGVGALLECAEHVCLAT